MSVGVIARLVLQGVTKVWLLVWSPGFWANGSAGCVCVRRVRCAGVCVCPLGSSVFLAQTTGIASPQRVQASMPSHAVRHCPVLPIHPPPSSHPHRTLVAHRKGLAALAKRGWSSAGRREHPPANGTSPSEEQGRDVDTVSREEGGHGCDYHDVLAVPAKVQTDISARYGILSRLIGTCVPV